MHGGSSTGPTAAGIERIRQARTIHGRYSAEMIELRQMVAMLRREARRAITAVPSDQQQDVGEHHLRLVSLGLLRLLQHTERHHADGAEFNAEC
jgi:hypothetical protein